MSPEDYPDIHKLSILADVAPYSREYNIFRQKVGKEAEGNTPSCRSNTRRSSIACVRPVSLSSAWRTAAFTAPVEEVEGTVESVSPAGVTLKEYPGLSVLPEPKILARGRAKDARLRPDT